MSGWDEEVVESEVDGTALLSQSKTGVAPVTKFNRTLASRSRSPTAGLTREDATAEDIDRSLYTIRFVVATWKARRRQLKQCVKDEVQKRRQHQAGSLIDQDYVMQSVMLRDLRVHTESAVDRALLNMAQNRRHGMLKLQASMVQRLLYVLEALGRLGAVHVESLLCIEVGAMLSDVLMGSSCDFYPVANANDGGRLETFVLVGCKRVPVNVKHTAFLGRIAARSVRGDRTATIISDPAAEIRDGATQGAGQAPENTRVARGSSTVPLYTTTFCDTGVGTRELLVRRQQDMELVVATLKARGYDSARSGSLEPTEIAQVCLARTRSSAAQWRLPQPGLSSA